MFQAIAKLQNSGEQTPHNIVNVHEILLKDGILYEELYFYTF